jgi:hypothetical protein
LSPAAVLAFVILQELERIVTPFALPFDLLRLLSAVLNK